MKKFLPFLFSTVAFLTLQTSQAQQLKGGVFDLDMMVQLMPGYSTVDSLVQAYVKDSLNPQYEIYLSEFRRLDSTYKADSPLVAQRVKSKTMLDYVSNER